MSSTKRRQMQVKMSSVLCHQCAAHLSSGHNMICKREKQLPTPKCAEQCAKLVHVL